MHISDMRLGDLIVVLVLAAGIGYIVFYYLGERRQELEERQVASFKTLTLAELNLWIEAALIQTERPAMTVWKAALKQGAELYRAIGEVGDQTDRSQYKMLVHATFEAWVIDHITATEQHEENRRLSKQRQNLRAS